MTFDVAVAGLGGIGSAIAAHCAARGASVIGLEQFGPVHDRGSSHGRSRMIRQAYFEDAAYVRMVLRSYQLWRELEERTGQQLLRITGVLSVGREESAIVSGTKRSAAEHNLPLETLSRRKVQERYPSLRLLPDEIGVFEPEAGVLDPERAVGAHLKMAEAAGAYLGFETSLQTWQASDYGITIHLSDN